MDKVGSRERPGRDASERATAAVWGECQDSPAWARQKADQTGGQRNLEKAQQM